MSAHPADVLETLRQRFTSMNAVPVTRAHITSDEFSAMEAEIAKLRNDLHLERMRLVACGVIALSDTPESAAKARDMLPEYRSASCDDVVRRVDECMKLRADLEAMLFLLEDAESSLSDYQQEVLFGDSDAQTLNALRAALRARGIT